MRGARKNESKAGPEWKVHQVQSGADPDDWTFYPPQEIPQDCPPGRWRGTDPREAFFKGSRSQNRK
jgi:hypothetical protein